MRTGSAPVADATASLIEARDRLWADGPTPGRAWCRAWTDAVDRLLRELHAASAHAPRLTVVAVGGYGREELCPHSDVDLLLLHDQLEAPALEVAVRELVYPLWDAGLQVGYAVRSRREAVTAAFNDLDAATALLDARWVAGPEPLLIAVRDGLRSRLRRRPARFLSQLRAADEARRAATGDAAEVLEPDLKRGAGGLRDVQSLRWAAAAIVGEPGLAPLVPAGYLGAPDQLRLAQAYERLLATRVALHLSLPRSPGVETLRLDVQDAVAARLGHADGGDHDTPAHRLLSEHFLAARTIAHVHRRAWTVMRSDLRRGRRRRRTPDRLVDGFEIADGVLSIPAPVRLEDAGLPTRLLLAMVRTGAVLDRRTVGELRRAAEGRDRPLEWRAEDRDRFVGALWRGSAVLPALAELDDAGLLVALLPEWAPLRGRAQRNPFHRFSLDRHAWHTAAALADLVRSERWASLALEFVEDRDALIVGALLHDVGKAYGEPHSETGVPVARAVAERIGLAAGSVDLVGRMVAEHLTLPDAATRRDVSDPALATELAARLDDRQTLAVLHLLAAADGIATGPTAWTPWKATLVEQLVRRVSAVLENDDVDRDPDGAPATAAAAQELAAELGATAEEVRDHLALLPPRYARALSPRAIVRHTLLTRGAAEEEGVRTRVTPAVGPLGDAHRYDELDVVAGDHPGLFADVAGVIALHGGSIVQAHAFTRGDGLAVDTFTVEPPEHGGGAWWLAVEADLAEASAGRFAIRPRVEARAAREATRLARRPEVATAVTTGPDPSGRVTVVEVRTGDRIGVLYRIASTMAELHLDVVVAKITTLGHEVVDAFYLRDARGEPLDDAHQRELVFALEAALEHWPPGA